MLRKGSLFGDHAFLMLIQAIDLSALGQSLRTQTALNPATVRCWSGSDQIGVSGLSANCQ